MTRRARLDVVRLEDRTTPVLGGFDVPWIMNTDVSMGADNLLGVVDYAGRGTGALLDVGPSVDGSRFVLTAAHVDPVVGDLVTVYMRNLDGTLKPISIPVTEVWIHPNWNGNVFANKFDIAIVTLAAVAPYGASTYEIYSNTQAAVRPEVGQQFLMAGFGRTGTGTSGQNTLDLQRLTVVATGGQFFLSYQGQTGTTALNWNATAAQIQTALQQNFGLQTQVRRPTVGPFTNSFEVLFLNGGNASRLGFVSNPASPLVNGTDLGRVDVITLSNGDNDGEFQRLVLDATGGSFRLGLGANFTVPLPFNATAAEIQDAIEALPGINEVTVRRVTTGPYAGTFQISFDNPNTNQPQMTVDTIGLVGTAQVYTLQDGGVPRAFRIGFNEYDSVQDHTLVSDFDPDGTDDFEGQGDSGGAGFIDLGGGKLSIASIVSYGGFVFGDTEHNTRVSTYTNDIKTVTGTFPYTLTLNMKYQLAGDDGQPDVIQVRRNGTRIEILASDVFGNVGRLYYADVASKIASVVIEGSSDDETIFIDGNLGVPVFVRGNGGNDTLVANTALPTRFTVTGKDAGSADAINTFFQGVENLTGGTGNDAFNFVTGGSITGNIDGGAGFETLDLSGFGGRNVTLTGPGATDGFDGVILGGDPVGGLFLNINAVVGSATGSSTLTGYDTPATFTQDGNAGTYADAATGRVLPYSNIQTLAGGALNDTFNIRSTVGAFQVLGNGGDDVVNVAGPTGDFGSYGGTIAIDGGAGTDVVNVAATAGNDNVVARILTPYGISQLDGLPAVLQFVTTERVRIDGRAGSNSLVVRDDSGVSYGTPSEPQGGFVYAPVGPDSGSVGVGGFVAFEFARMAALAVDGDGDGAGATDVLMVLGTSTTGYQSAFGERTVANGADVIVVNDETVTVANPALGTLRPVLVTYNAFGSTFNTIYVFAGNEPGPVGDNVTVTPSNRVNLLVDGGAPLGRSPGDRVTVLANSATVTERFNDPAFGPVHTRVTQTSDGASVGLLGFEQTPGQELGMIAVGSDAGTETRVEVYDPRSGRLRFTVNPFPGFTGGATVASGDVNGDGVSDLIVGAGPGGGPLVAVFDGLDGRLITSFFAFEETFTGGVIVSSGDFNGDGFADIILGTGVGGGPRVLVVSGRDQSKLLDVFVYEDSFRGGVNVAAADLNGDGVPDLVTSTGAGGGPRVVVFDGRTLRVLADFFVFDPASRTGFYATAGDVTGDGVPDIIVGAGAGGPAQVRVFSGFNLQLVTEFFVNDPFDPGPIPYIPFDSGVRVAAADVDGDGIDEIITGKGPGTTPTLRIYQVGSVNPQTNALRISLQELRRQDVFDDTFGFGIFVGADS